jgi:hypothetical protein
MTAELVKKGEQLFCAALALEETWVEVDRLVEALDDVLTRTLVVENKLYAKLELDGSEAEIPEQTMWSYQYNFKGYKKGPGRPKPNMFLSYEFRLCWPLGKKIEYANGGEAKIPLIIVKLTSDRVQNFECYDVFCSPTERTDSDGYEYQVHNRLIWAAEDEHWF